MDHVSYILSDFETGDIVKYNDYQKIPLTFEILSAGTINWTCWGYLDEVSPEDIEEAKQTIGNDNKGGFQAIGHKELYPAILGEDTIDNCVEKLKQQTRRYAKRQMTWFKRDDRIIWLYTDEDSDYIETALKIAEKF